MPLSLQAPDRWQVQRIGVVGPGIVGMPMAALLAHARIREGSEVPAEVLVVQRPSPTSGWKVDAINAGRSPIGGVEPGLDRIVAEAVAAGTLRAAHDPLRLRDADVILVCTQTDKAGLAPDYGPLFDALDGVARAVAARTPGHVPVVVFESTLAPSTMTTLIRDFFARRGLLDGRDVLLGNSPNRVMPGRLVERVVQADKLVGGLHPLTPALAARVYRHVVTVGTLHQTNSLTAEIVKTLENAYRDVRIAFAADLARYCDERDIDFFSLRHEVNTRLAQSDAAGRDPNAVPTGALLVPTVGVGGHCLPKDGILMLWRLIESGADLTSSVFLEARRINDESPAATLALAERAFGPLAGRKVALLGVAYRFNSEDTRNSPTLELARILQRRGCRITLHDPYVNEGDVNLARHGLADQFTCDLTAGLAEADFVFVCVAHQDYVAGLDTILASGPCLCGIVDGCNAFRVEKVDGRVGYAGIGRGRRLAGPRLVDYVIACFRVVETAVVNELARLVAFLNARYARDDFNYAQMDQIRHLAGTVVTGCALPKPGPIPAVPQEEGFSPRLLRVAVPSSEFGQIPAGVNQVSRLWT